MAECTGQHLFEELLDFVVGEVGGLRTGDLQDTILEGHVEIIPFGTDNSDPKSSRLPIGLFIQ